MAVFSELNIKYFCFYLKNLKKNDKIRYVVVFRNLPYRYLNRQKTLSLREKTNTVGYGTLWYLVKFESPAVCTCKKGRPFAFG